MPLLGIVRVSRDFRIVHAAGLQLAHEILRNAAWKEHYQGAQEHRANGIGHQQAQRCVGNQLILIGLAGQHVGELTDRAEPQRDLNGMAQGPAGGNNGAAGKQALHDERQHNGAPKQPAMLPDHVDIDQHAQRNEEQRVKKCREMA